MPRLPISVHASLVFRLFPFPHFTPLCFFLTDVPVIPRLMYISSVSTTGLSLFISMFKSIYPIDVMGVAEKIRKMSVNYRR